MSAVAFAFSSKDKPLAIKWAKWVEDLGGCETHDLILTVARSATPEGVVEPLKRAFRSVTLNIPYDDEEGWPQGPNLLWKRTVEFVAIGEKGMFRKPPQPWLWVEPDAIPIRKNWISDIFMEYDEQKKPFMGSLVDIPGSSKHLSGIAVYPAIVINYTDQFINLHSIAWDMFLAPDFLKYAGYTNMIHHVFWQSENQSPTFPDLKSLETINPEARIFHRCKDGTLTDRLREKMGLAQSKTIVPIEIQAHPSLEKTSAKIIHTYFEPVPEMPKDDNLKLIEQWKTAWREKGWNPIVLGIEDAQKHPLFNAATLVFSGFPTINPKGYELSCWRRHLAMAMIGGFMSDFDVFPLSADFTTDGDLTFYSGNERDPRIPCLVHGTKEGYQAVVMQFLGMTTKEKHFSDMIALGQQAPPNTFIKQVLEYGDPGWQRASAVHFSHHAMGDKRPKWKHIPNLLKSVIPVLSTNPPPELNVKDAPKTIADQFRFHVAELIKICDGKQGRIIALQNELRKQRLIPKARKR